jgi:integrase
MTIYTLEKLTEDLEYCINSTDLVSPYNALLMKVLLSTGCRPIELFDAGRWSDLDINNISLLPAKGNYSRIISKSILPPPFLDSLLADNLISARLNISSLRRYFYKFMPNRPSFINIPYSNSEIGLYLFRHRSIKYDYANTQNYNETAENYGENEVGHIVNYVNSKLYYS